MRLNFFVLLLTCTLSFQGSSAELLQILHTNDLHGFLQNTIKNPSRGGYARIKSLMDEHERLASTQDITTLRFDGGDFVEGNLFIQAEQGRKVWGIMNLMDYDAVVMGNHDYLMGEGQLLSLFKDVPPQFNYLAANFYPHFPYRELSKYFKPYKMFQVGGFKVAVLGLTTNEILYTWTLKTSKIKNIVKEAKRWIKKIKKKEAPDFIILLTHVGLSKDKKIIEATKDVDLVVGGHSHDAFMEPKYAENRRGKKIPIIQSGYHGQYLGKGIFELHAKGDLRVKNYQMLPIRSELEEDEHVSSFVDEAEQDLFDLYGRDYLQEVLGFTTIPLTNPDGESSYWTRYVANAFREMTSADIAVHTAKFSGSDLPAGPLTRRSLMNSYPRAFELNQVDGWSLYTVEVYGFLLKAVLNLVLNSKYDLDISGAFVEYNEDDEDSLGKRRRIKRIIVNGQKLKPFQLYRLALPEGVTRGGLGITDLVKLIFRNVTRTDYSIWNVIMDKVAKDKELGSGSEFTDQGPLYHTFVPALEP